MPTAGATSCELLWCGARGPPYAISDQRWDHVVYLTASWRKTSLSLSMYVCMYVCMYIYIYICMYYVYIYIYTYTYIYTHTVLYTHIHNTTMCLHACNTSMLVLAPRGRRGVASRTRRPSRARPGRTPGCVIVHIIHRGHTCVYVYVCVYIYTYIYICMYMHIYIYIYFYANTHEHVVGWRAGIKLTSKPLKCTLTHGTNG